MDESDAEIVRRSTNEDAKAFGELFWRHNGAVHGYLARRAGRDTADDLVAEVWLRAFRNRSNFDLGYPDARPWLYGIARNVLHSHWRQMNKALPLLPSACTDPWPDVDELLDQGYSEFIVQGERLETSDCTALMHIEKAAKAVGASVSWTSIPDWTRYVDSDRPK